MYVVYVAIVDFCHNEYLVRHLYLGAMWGAARTRHVAETQLQCLERDRLLSVTQIVACVYCAYCWVTCSATCREHFR